MSTWGGIGEGLTAGMNARIAQEEQRRREALAQKNADRQFAFQQEQANRAQENADRQFEAGRTDAANAQANADRVFNEGVRRADLAQANASREYAMKRDELALKSDIAVAENDRANAELALKQEAQDWANETNEERLRGFRLANEKLDREERQAQMIDDAKRESGRQQLAMAIYRVTGGGGQEQTIKINENGQMVDKKVRVLPQSAREQIFGKDGYFRDVQNVVAFEDESGKTIAALVKPDGTMQMFSPEDQYSVYESGFGKGFADETMQSMADKRDLGMFAAKEEAKAKAYNIRNKGGAGYAFAERATLQLMRNPDKADEIAEYLGVPKDELINIFKNTIGGNANLVGGEGRSSGVISPDSPQGKAALARGYTFDGTQWHPPKNKRIVAPSGK